jgi:glycosyltransferase involved in cell wall biosynthesis
MAAAGRPRVLLLIPHVGGGGAEQVTELLARHLSREKYDLHLGLVTQRERGDRAASLQLPVFALGADKVRVAALPVLRLVWSLRPDLILSCMAHLNFLVLGMRPLFPSVTRVVVRQNGMASETIRSGGLPLATGALYRLLYPTADRVICQTAAMARDLHVVFDVPSECMRVLPNPVDLAGVYMPGGCGPWTSTGSGPHLLAVGRLAREKGFDLLLRALAEVRKEFRHADLTILGSGPEEISLKSLRVELGLDEAVRFEGYKPEPAAYFSGTSLFVLSSRHEGLPSALLEAAAAGLPIAASPSAGGVAELLRGQPGVWLARDLSCTALAASIVAALTALNPGQRFVHSFVEPFRLKNAIPQYEALIDAVLDEARR